MIASDKLVIAMLTSLKKQLLASDVPWEATLGEMGWTEQEVADAMADFRAKPPSIIQGWPRKEGPWPIWCVTLGGENPESDFLNRYLEERREDDEAVDIEGTISEQQVNISVWTQNGDRTREHAELIMAGMILMITDASPPNYFAGQQDLHYDMQFYPSTLFVREQAWKFVQERRVAKTRDDRIVLQPVFATVTGHEAGDYEGEVVMGSVEEYEDR